MPMQLVVSPKDNIQLDETGQFVLDEEGVPVLIDENIVGMQIKTHIIQVSQLNQVTNQLETGVVQRAEVVWEHKRCPATELVPPEDLVWLSLNSGDEEFEETEDDGEEEYEENEDYDNEPGNFAQY